MTREKATAKYAFPIRRNQIKNRTLIPKYYDPVLTQDILAEEKKWEAPWVSLHDLVNEGMLSAETGIEIGKMAYGTGQIPFIRTSDIADLEVKADPRQGISKAIFDAAGAKGVVEEGDVLVVRDGTYLVGSSAIVTNTDTPALISGGLYRLRSLAPKKLDPNALLGLLNLPIVRRQMRARQFTRDVIDTLGYRLFEVRIPNPMSKEAKNIGRKLGAILTSKFSLRDRIGVAVSQLEPVVPTKSRNRPGWSMRG